MSADSPNLSQPADWLGYFYGHDLEFNHAELLAIQHIPKATLKRESELMRTKWFDYRRLHPTKATYYCVHCYTQAYRNCMKQMKDISGQYMRGFKVIDFMESREKTAVWKLRQLIDSLGIRYEFFMHHAMEWHILAGWLQPPRPCHLASNTDMITDIMLLWEEECKAKMQYARDPRYKVGNWFGHSDQIAYEKFLIEQINQRRHPQYALQSALYIENALRIEAAIENFNERVLNEAVALP